MLFTAAEVGLLTAACSGRGNMKAQEILNVLGTNVGPEIVVQCTSLPREVQVVLEKQIREAIDEQKRRIRPR